MIKILSDLSIKVIISFNDLVFMRGNQHLLRVDLESNHVQLFEVEIDLYTLEIINRLTTQVKEMK